MGGRRDEEGRPSRWRTPWGLIGMLGLVWAVEWTLAGHDIDFTAPWHWDWRVIGKAATRPARVAGKDVLIFGDSLAKFGLMPRIIKERSGRVTYNFALHTGQTSSSYFMFRRALRAGARPSAVVLDLTPHMFSLGPSQNNNLWGELLSPGEALDLAWATRDPEFLGSTVLASYLTSCKERHEIRAEFAAKLRGETVSRRKQIPQFRRNWKVNEGAQLMGDSPAPTLDLDVWVNHLFPRWSPHPVNLAYLDRFLDLAKAEHIPVYWLLTPIHPDLLARLTASGFEAEHTRFVRQVQARYPGTIVVDTRGSGFAADLFFDGLHLNRRGAIRLSAAVADVLRDRRGEGSKDRWISLGPGRSWITEFPIEDVMQSAEVIKAEESRVLR